MKSIVFVVAVTAALPATLALAQSDANAPAGSAEQSDAARQAIAGAQSSAGGSNGSQRMQGLNMRQQIQNSLSQDGFTNVTVQPSSFFVRATNKQGQPVAMVISPDSITAVTEIGVGASGGSASGSGGQASGSLTKSSTGAQP